MSSNNVVYTDCELRKWTGLYKIHMINTLSKFLIRDISKIIIDYVY